MFKNLFNKMFNFHDIEDVKYEEELRKMTSESLIKEFNPKKINTENKKDMSEEIKNEVEAEEVLEQPEVNNEEIQEPIVEDVPAEVSEETEVVEQPVEELAEEQPNQEVEGNEPPEAEPVEAPQEEVQEEPKQEEEVAPVENQEEVVEPKAEDEQPAEVEQPIEEPQPEQPQVPENVVKDLAINTVVEQVAADEKEVLLKEIANLKAEKEEQAIAMKKMELSKEIESNFAGVPGKVEDKVGMIYEIQNSALSENAKTFVLNSLKSLSAQNLSDCEEIGHSQEPEVDENAEKENKIKNAMKEHGLTENQAFLFVNGDRTLAEAKKASNKVLSKRK